MHAPRQDRDGPVRGSAQRRRAGLHRRQRTAGAGSDWREATFDGFYAPVDNQPTINKAKAGQTIPMKWRLAAPSVRHELGGLLPVQQREQRWHPNQDDWTTRQVDSLVFQARCASDPGNDADVHPREGNGFLIDNVSFTSSRIETTLPIAAAGVSDPSVYGTPPFTFTAEQAVGVRPRRGHRPDRGVRRPGAEWSDVPRQRRVAVQLADAEVVAGNCVELTLNLTGDSRAVQVHQVAVPQEVRTRLRRE